MKPPLCTCDSIYILGIKFMPSVTGAIHNDLNAHGLFLYKNLFELTANFKTLLGGRWHMSVQRDPHR